MNNKKIWIITLVSALLVSAFTGCGQTGNVTLNHTKYSIVCTIFPEYDWVREVLGDRAEDFELTLLLDNGVDLHNYQPTADDIARIAACDVFIYVGGESDKWIEDALKETSNKNMRVINLLNSLGDAVKEEELIEGMEGEEADHEGEEETEYDEHVWLSLKNSEVLVNVIADEICMVDAENAVTYKNNAADYVSRLADLDTEYQEVTNQANVDTILFGDRFPFRYLADDYGLHYYAAFPGCSAETEASFETIAFLAGKADELKLSKILVPESSDRKIAQTIIASTNDKNQEILVMDSMQSVTTQDIADGTTYLSVMKNNLEVLKQALQ